MRVERSGCNAAIMGARRRAAIKNARLTSIHNCAKYVRDAGLYAVGHFAGARPATGALRFGPWRHRTAPFLVMKTWVIAIPLGVLIVGLLAWLTVRRDDVGQTQKLPDGSTLQLLEIAFPRTNYTFQYRRGNRFIRKILPLLSPSMRSRFSGGSGSLGWSGLEGTNLIAITLNRSDAKA